MPLVSVATISWVVSEALSSKISAVVLFPENISSACKIGLLQHEYHCFELCLPCYNGHYIYIFIMICKLFFFFRSYMAV